MVIAQLFDLAVNNLYHLCAKRLDDFAFPRTRAVKEGFRYAAAIVTGEHAQIAATVGKKCKRGLVIAPYLLSAGKVSSLRVNDEGDSRESRPSLPRCRDG